MKNAFMLPAAATIAISANFLIRSEAIHAQSISINGTSLSNGRSSIPVTGTGTTGTGTIGTGTTTGTGTTGTGTTGGTTGTGTGTGTGGTSPTGAGSLSTGPQNNISTPNFINALPINTIFFQPSILKGSFTVPQETIGLPPAPQTVATVNSDNICRASEPLSGDSPNRLAVSRHPADVTSINGACGYEPSGNSPSSTLIDGRMQLGYFYGEGSATQKQIRLPGNTENLNETEARSEDHNSSSIFESGLNCSNFVGLCGTP